MRRLASAWKAVLLLRVRRAYYRWQTVRELMVAARWPWLRRGGLPDLAHLALYEEGPMRGPVQRDEALFLHGLVRTVRPRTIVEVGFAEGHSAFNFLRALDDEGLVLIRHRSVLR